MQIVIYFIIFQLKILAFKTQKSLKNLIYFKTNYLKSEGATYIKFLEDIISLSHNCLPVHQFPHGHAKTGISSLHF